MNRFRWFRFLFVTFTILTIHSATASARAEELAKLAGAWEGILKINPAAELRVVFRIDASDPKAVKVTLDSPDQGATGIKVDEATIQKGRVIFVAKGINGRFDGTWDEAGNKITGEWAQGGGKLPLTLSKNDQASSTPEIWEGSLEVPGAAKLRIVFRLTENADGTLRSTMDSPDQGAFGIKVEKTERSNDGTVIFRVPVITGEYEGKRDASGTEIRGTWKQGGGSVPLNLKKVSKPSEARRPQHPMPPVPYVIEQVAYENPTAGITLAGTLTKPEGSGPFPAALMITGSGPQDRDETLFGHKPFLVIADALTRQGIVVLRVDDRGVGQSSGDFATATSEDFASDVHAGIAYLKGRKEVDPKRIGLIGHSEGGIIAPMVASSSEDVAFIVLMAGTGLPGIDILAMQSDRILRANNASEETAQQRSALVRRLAEEAIADLDDQSRKARMEAILKQMVESLPEAERAAISGAAEFLDGQLRQLTTPWFRFFLKYDPRPTLAKVRCPVLAINGEKDTQVPSKENLAEIENALKAGGNDRITIKEFKGLNHLFQRCQTGAPVEYAAIEETISPQVLKEIGDWILGVKPRG